MPRPLAPLGSCGKIRGFQSFSQSSCRRLRHPLYSAYRNASQRCQLFHPALERTFQCTRHLHACSAMPLHSTLDCHHVDQSRHKMSLEPSSDRKTLLMLRVFHFVPSDFLSVSKGVMRRKVRFSQCPLSTHIGHSAKVCFPPIRDIRFMSALTSC